VKPKKFFSWLYMQIKKNFIKRLSWWSFIAVVALLGDEYLKEGYLFNIKEIANPFCHEFWILVFSVIAVISTYISEEKELRKGGENAEE